MSSSLSRGARTLAKEIITVIVTILGLLAVTFFIARVMPVDPVLAVVGDNARPDVYERARREMGLDKPVLVQFWLYIQKVFQGDFGRSVLTSNLVIDDIKRVFPGDAGTRHARDPDRSDIGHSARRSRRDAAGPWPDHIARFIGLFGYSIPIFWLGLMGLLIFYAKLGWVSGPGRIAVSYQDFVTPITGVLLLDCALQGEWEAFRNAVSHLILPSAVLGLFSTAYISRMTRSFMINELQQPYVMTARVKGLPERRVVWGHALRNAMVPLLTVIALSYANLLEGSVLTETVFRLARPWPLHHQFAAQR